MKHKKIGWVVVYNNPRSGRTHTVCETREEARVLKRKFGAEIFRNEFKLVKSEIVI